MMVLRPPGVSQEPSSSFVVRPHAQYTHGALFLEYFVDETALDVDSARIGSVEISYELLAGRRIPKWIDSQDFERS
jgi:hypothetical protein